MNVSKHSVVSIDYTLKNSDGEVIDSSEGSDPLAYLHGEGNIIPGLESALAGKAVGDEITAVIPPEDGYGLRNEDLVQVVPRERFGDIGDIDVGMRFRVPTEDQGEVIVAVVDVQSETVTIDGNHDLAGEELHFAVTIREIRDATEEEINHGHAHAGDGHHH